MKLLGKINYLLSSKIKTFSTHLILKVLIHYHQEVKIHPILII